MAVKEFLIRLLRGIAAVPKNPRVRRWLVNSRRPGRWITASVLCFAVVLTILTLVKPKKDFSEKENRNLARMPALSVSALADGSFARDTEKSFADQFIGRNFWISLNLKFRTLMGRKENGGVYLGKKKTLFLVPSRPNEAALARNLEAMNRFAAEYPDVETYVAVIPNASSILTKKLPAHAPVPDQAAQLALIREGVPKARFIDVTGALTEHRDEALFYRTDHHWTSLGAYYAFTAIASEMGIDAPAAEDYEILPVSTTFSGTLAAKSGKNVSPDTVELFVPKTDVEYNVSYVESKEKTATMYKREALESRDHYAVFFGGNYPRVDIRTTADTGRRLLLFKDSYANCLMQFLYPYFEEIVMVDPRYYYDSAAPLITQHNITDVLYLYNCDTFVTDTVLADALAAPQLQTSAVSQTAPPAETAAGEQTGN